METREHWDICIQPKRGLLDLDLQALWRYRDLVLMFVRRDFVAFYKQTVLGPIWYVLQPLLMTSVFTVVFNRIANIPTDSLPPFLFYLCGLVAWNYFASCITKTADVFTSNAAIFGKVYFPRLTVPASVIITNVAAFAMQLLLVGAFLVYFALRGAPVIPSIYLFALPLILIHMAALALGVGILLSSLTTRYRDITFVIGFGVQLWMYATPVVYPLSQVPERWHWVMAFNPMTPILESFRRAVLGVGTVYPVHVVASVATTVAVLFLGLIMFNRVARSATDTI